MPEIGENNRGPVGLIADVTSTGGGPRVARLRVRIGQLEGEQPSDPRIGEARRELRALSGAVEGHGVTGKQAETCGGWHGAARASRFFVSDRQWHETLAQCGNL